MRGICTTVVITALFCAGLPGAAATSAAAELPGVRWAPCSGADLRGTEFECAILRVPLDRSGLTPGEVRLALARHRSTGSDAERIGSLVFNPGGPGSAGSSAIEGVWLTLPDAVKARFDLVTWDPRGTGESTPALNGCTRPAIERPLVGPVDWEAVGRQFAKDLAVVNGRCQAANARIAQHMGTNDAVADLEAIRVALGEEQLTYWGASYGTRIGYVYALAHPRRVRAMVLDGPVDPAGSIIGLAQGGVAPEQAFGAFAQQHEEAARQLTELLRALGKRTVRLPHGQHLDRWVVAETVYRQIPGELTYPLLADIIGDWHRAVLSGEADRRSAREAAAEWVSAMRPAVTSASAGAAFSIVNCLDYADRPSFERVLRAVRYQRRLAPRYGATIALSFAFSCAGLSIKPDPIPVITGGGSNVPVLILGSSRDGATPSLWTPRMARAFPRSRTVTYAGGQHVVWGMARSSCVDDTANAYVIDRVLPVADVGCPNRYIDTADTH